MDDPGFFDIFGAFCPSIRDAAVGLGAYVAWRAYHARRRVLRTPDEVRVDQSLALQQRGTEANEKMVELAQMQHDALERTKAEEVKRLAPFRLRPLTVDSFTGTPMLLGHDPSLTPTHLAPERRNSDIEFERNLKAGMYAADGEPNPDTITPPTPAPVTDIPVVPINRPIHRLSKEEQCRIYAARAEERKKQRLAQERIDAEKREAEARIDPAKHELTYLTHPAPTITENAPVPIDRPVRKSGRTKTPYTRNKTKRR